MHKMHPLQQDHQSDLRTKPAAERRRFYFFLFCGLCVFSALPGSPSFGTRTRCTNVFKEYTSDKTQQKSVREVEYPARF